jgi:large subunit ribosomal protein L25
MAQDIKIKADVRVEQGSAASRRLRRSGSVPGIVYGGDNEPRMIELNEHDFSLLLAHHASEHLIMDLQVGKDKMVKVLLEEVQHHPVSGRVMHVDFREISMTEKISLAVPVELTGEPVGVATQGGVLEQMLREVEVECLPADVLEQIEVDVSGLHIGETATVAVIELDSAKYTVLTAADVALAGVAAPRVAEDAEEGEEEAESSDQEPEVIGEKKDAEEEG